jgi:putative ABC transport system substrate-binding protein
MVRNKQIKPKHPMLVMTLLVVVCVFLSGCGDKKQKVYRVGIVFGVETFIDIADGFRAKMAELGYVEGENIVYDLQKLNADPTAEKSAAEKFVQDNVDMIFAFPTEPALAAKAATQGTDIPVVFALAGIEGNNLIDSVSEPGGNITGVRFPGPEITVKRLDILHELVPQAKRVYIIYDPNYPTAPSALKDLRPAASSLGLTLVEDPVKNIEELKAALQKRTELENIGIDAILIMPEILTQSPDGFSAVLTFANKHNLPIGGSLVYTAELGALFSYIPDNLEMGMQAATMADKIFKGIPTGTIMVVTPVSYLRLNYKVIQGFGLKVPQGLLSMAVEIIR